MWRPTGRSIKALVGTLAWLLCIGIFVSMAIEVGSSAISPTSSSAAAPHATLGVSSRAMLRGNLHLDPLLDSKRRVPNGPDPVKCFHIWETTSLCRQPHHLIHNIYIFLFLFSRRAGKSGRPPGRA